MRLLAALLVLVLVVGCGGPAERAVGGGHADGVVGAGLDGDAAPGSDDQPATDGEAERDNRGPKWRRFYDDDENDNEWPDPFAGKDVVTCTTSAGITVRAATTRDHIELVFPDGYSSSGTRFNVEAERWRFAINSGGAMHDGHYLFAITTWIVGSDEQPPPAEGPETVLITARAFTAPPGAADELQFELLIDGEAIEITSCQ